MACGRQDPAAQRRKSVRLDELHAREVESYVVAPDNDDVDDETYEQESEQESEEESEEEDPQTGAGSRKRKVQHSARTRESSRCDC